ncbi:MAG: hypothetical protein C5B59_07815 [Bacteroidetes bacterium]|nr:MAG: hypothetical protein C5B59_07815 [Bacteroidota bacterium]
MIDWPFKPANDLVLISWKSKKIHIQGHGGADADFNFTKTNDWYRTDDYLDIALNAVDNEGAKCFVRLVLFKPVPNKAHCANLTIVWIDSKRGCMFRLKRDDQ